MSRGIKAKVDPITPAPNVLTFRVGDKVIVSYGGAYRLGEIVGRDEEARTVRVRSLLTHEYPAEFTAFYEALDTPTQVLADVLMALVRAFEGEKESYWINSYLVDVLTSYSSRQGVSDE